MAGGVGARYQGGDYQHRLFWISACHMFFPDSNVVRVGLELEGPTGFDDLAEAYDMPATGPRGEPIRSTFWQAKFHRGSEGAFRSSSFTDPKYVGSKHRTLLRNLRDARREHPDSCFRFATVDPLATGDPIAQLVSNDEGELLLERLYDGTGPRGTMGGLRAEWSDHLDLSEGELRSILGSLRLETGRGNLETLNKQLELALRAAGLKPLRGSASHSPYDDLARKFVKEGQGWFDRESLDERLVREKLRRSPPVDDPMAVTAGIRSFSRGAETMPQEVTPFLDLLPFFNGRVLAPDADWEAVAREVSGFMRRAASRSRRFSLRLATHKTVAFIAGREVDGKSGVGVAPVQTTVGKGLVRWASDHGGEGPPLTLEKVGLGGGADLAIAVSITHDIKDDVTRHLNHQLPNVGELLHLTLGDKVSSTSIGGGKHATRLADQAIRKIRRSRGSLDPAATTHLFWAAPVSFTFLLGQRSRVLGACQLYEHDFGKAGGEVYSPSIRLEPGK